MITIITIDNKEGYTSQVREGRETLYNKETEELQWKYLDIFRALNEYREYVQDLVSNIPELLDEEEETAIKIFGKEFIIETR